MKSEKKLVVLTGFLFLTVFMLGITSAVDLCWIESSASTCTATTGNQVVMYVSSSTNAHGELESYSPHQYSQVLCCNFGSGDTTCTADNKIIGLSSPTNAHAERPENSNYNSNVCYDGLTSCFSVSGGVNCAGASLGELQVLSLSSSTNAHLEDSSLQNYDTKICCKVVVSGIEPPPPPGDPRAFWSDSNFVELTFLNVVPDFTSVNLVLENTNFAENTTVDFDIFENEFGPDTSIRTVVGTTDSNGRVVATWLITSEDLDTATDFEEFYFVANGEQSGFFTINVFNSCSTIITCGDYTQDICESDVCKVAEFSVPESIDCSDPDINCYCTQNVNTCISGFSYTSSSCGDGTVDFGETCDGSDWGPITGCSDFNEFTGGSLSCGSTCNFDTSLCTGGNVGVLGDGIINPGETCDGSDWGGITGCSDFNEFTGGILSCDSTGHFDTSQCTIYGDGIINPGETCDGSNWGSITGCSDFGNFTGGVLSCGSTGHFDTSLCTGGVLGVYGDGIINLGETCDGSDWGGITGCSDFNEFTGGILSCESPGQFNTFQCIGVETTGEIGTCLITEGDVDENGCDDGFLIISWTGQWVWNDEENPGHLDPKGLSSLCTTGGTRVIECPAQIKLPFFGFYNIIATIFLITIIYFILVMRRNKDN